MARLSLATGGYYRRFGQPSGSMRYWPTTVLKGELVTAIIALKHAPDQREEWAKRAQRLEAILTKRRFPIDEVLEDWRHGCFAGARGETWLPDQ
jgi:hypothetical protein